MTSRRPSVVGAADAVQYVVWCPVPMLDALVNSVIRAMYYLPHQFVLLLPSTTMTKEMAAMLPIANRIRVYEIKSSSQDELLRTAQVIVHGDDVAEGYTLPSVAVSESTVGVSPTARGYESTLSPEAIATALLKVSGASL